MRFDGSARILGTFEGQSCTTGQIEVGHGATCNARLEAARIVIDGEVNGDISASDRLELNERARVNGDLAAGNLVVVEGAAFTGHVSVGPDAVPTQPGSQQGERPAVETRPARPAPTSRQRDPEPAHAPAARAEEDWMRFAEPAGGSNPHGQNGSNAA